MASAEGSLPRPEGLARLIDVRFSREGAALVVRPPALVYPVGAAGVLIGLGVAANGVWGRTGSGGQIAFGVLYALVGSWFLVLASRRWVSADADGLRVGPIRRVRVPWGEVTGVMVRNASGWGVGPVSLRIERRSQRSLTLMPVFGLRTYRHVAELRYVAKRLAQEGARHGCDPIRWPTDLTFRERDGETHRVT